MPGISYREELKRKLIHLSSLWIPLVMWHFPGWALVIIFVLLALLTLTLERAYARRDPVIAPLYERFFGAMLRQKPRPDQWLVSGGFYVLASAAITMALFPRGTACAAFLVLLLSDTAAALIGRKFGKTKLVNGKSVEGVAAFLITGWLAVWIFGLTAGGFSAGALLAGTLGVAVGAWVELHEKQLRVDDNFSIPLAVGACFWLVPLFGGVMP